MRNREAYPASENAGKLHSMLNTVYSARKQMTFGAILIGLLLVEAKHWGCSELNINVWH